MPPSVQQLSMLALTLIAYALIHSLLASLSCKRWVAGRWPGLMPGYRLLFNLLAVVFLIPVAALLWRYPGELLWRWSGWQLWLSNGLALAALAAFVHSLGGYDLSLFSGTRQWRERSAQVDGLEPFRISFWHRFVRHPWYCFVLIVLWTREMNAAQLLTYGLFTLYFVIGSRLEEGKLIALYGDTYRAYCRRVPGLMPLPWKWLTRDQALSLESAQD